MAEAKPSVVAAKPVSSIRGTMPPTKAKIESN